MLYIMTRLDHIVILIKDLIPDVVGLGSLVFLELLSQGPNGLVLLLELLSLGVHLPPKPGHLPLDPTGNLWLLSHKLPLT